MSASALRPSVPDPPDRPLNLFQFLRAVRTNALTIWPRCAYDEPVFSRHFVGRMNILLNDPEAIHHVLVTNASNYRRSPASIRILRPITGDGLILSEGEAWKFQRRTVAPAFAPRVIPLLARHIVNATRDAIVRLNARAGQPIDLLAEMQGLALEIAGRSMFSLEMEQHGAAMRRLLTQFAERHSRPGLLDMLLPSQIPTPGDFGRARFKRRWMALIESILASRLATPPPEAPADLLDVLRSARDPETGRALSMQQLRDQVATLILAGHETTAVTLFWALFMLAQAPAEQAIVAQEAAATLIEPETAGSVLPGLVQTRAVINETLRLFPPAFTVVREAIGSDRVGEVRLSPRTIVMIAPWVLHRHRSLWDDPEVFLPSRFGPNQSPPPRYAFLPFGAGPRVCVGAQFAMAEAVLILASLMREFRISLPDGGPVPPVAIVTTQPGRQVFAEFSRRSR